MMLNPYRTCVRSFNVLMACLLLAGGCANPPAQSPASAPRAERAGPPLYSFDFSGAASEGRTAVTPATEWSRERGYGFEEHGELVASASGISSTQPFHFSLLVPQEGNYEIEVTLGDQQTESVTTIKAELRRLMVEEIRTAPGEFKTIRFIVNTRTPRIAATGDIEAGEVRLKSPRETTQEAWAWDDRITLEFNNARPAIRQMNVIPVNVPTIFVIGDSTVCDQSREPFASWGQMLTRYFKPRVAVANHGESGESYRDSIGRRRLDKMLSVMKPGDYMLMQFGHNDQKQTGPNAGPFLNYKQEIKVHIDAVRKHGGIPVVISPMERRGFDANNKVRRSLQEYAEGARQAAQESNAAFIDLNAMSVPLYEALEAQGPEYSRKAFAGNDNTHHNNYGSYTLANFIIQGLQMNKLDIATYVVDDFQPVDPAKPNLPEAFKLPPSPRVTNQTPLGS